MIANFIRSNFHDFGVPNHFPQGLYNDFDQCDIGVDTKKEYSFVDKFDIKLRGFEKW